MVLINKIQGERKVIATLTRTENRICCYELNVPQALSKRAHLRHVLAKGIYRHYSKQPIKTLVFQNTRNCQTHNY
mgnify:CR=1